MHYDILIFAAIAAFLVYRLYSHVGTRGDHDRHRQNPFAPKDLRARAGEGQVVELKPAAARKAPPPAPVDFGQMIDAQANADGKVEEGLAEIAAADAQFEVGRFMQGARMAFEMIVTAYAAGDRKTLKPLLSPKLYADFDSGISAREAQGHTSEVTVHRIKAARIMEAHLGGAMAYVTVDFDVEETAVVRDRDGNIVSGNPDRTFSVEDIWTFTRDTRSADPNWILIETRAAEKPSST